MAGRQQSFLSGAAVLSAAVAVTKVLGALYKIPLGNLLGAQGLAHFYAAYNVFNVFVMLSGGLPVALSRRVSQCCALGRQEQTRRIFAAALRALCIFGLTGSAAMWLFARPLAALLHDGEAVYAIRALSPALLLSCFCGAFRGYSQGLGDMRPTAVSQMLESVGKLVVGLGLCFLLLRRDASLSQAAAGALAGVSAGSLLALFYLRAKIPVSSCFPCTRSTLGGLVQTAVPITVSAAGMSVLTLLDQSLVSHTLQHALGYSEQEAVIAYGEYTLSATLFVLVPSLLIPLSAALMPHISGALAARRPRSAGQYVRQALRLTVTAALPLGVGLSLLAKPLLSILYPAQQESLAAAAWHLSVLGIAAVFVSLTAVCSGILQAYGKPLVPLAALGVGGSIKILCNLFLVAQSTVAVRGVSVGTLLCYAAMALVELWAIRRICPEAGGIYFPASALSAAVMALGVRSAEGLWLSRYPAALVCLPAALLGGGIYCILLTALGGFTKQDFACLRQRHFYIRRKSP